MELLRKLFGAPHLPPTKDGYQAPSGALAVGWQCPEPDCGEAEYFAAPRPSVPRRCHECGSATSPRHAWPWQHGERRAELDRLRERAEREGDGYLALPVRFHLLAWTFEDHLMKGDRHAALTVLDDADGQLRTTMKEERHFTEGSHRMVFVLGALRSGDPDIALRVIEPWVALARGQGPGYGTDLESDNASRTNHRSLVSSCFAWLDDARTAPQSHPAYDKVVGWALDTARAEHVRNWLTADQDARVARLDPYGR